MTTPKPSSPKKSGAFGWLDQHFNDLIVVIIALVTVSAGIVAFLQSWAGNHYAADIRRSQVLAIEAMGQDMRSRQQDENDFALYTLWNEWDWRRIRAKKIDPIVSARAGHIADLIVPMTPLLSEPYYDAESGTSDLNAYYADINVVTTTLLLEERAFTVETAAAWNSKADSYVTILTLLAVSLFLYGLATTVKGKVRYLFALVGTVLVGLASFWGISLTLSPVPQVPQEAISAYARGKGLYYSGKTEEARAAFDAALQSYPEYGNAYEARAEILLDLGEYAEAAQDYQAALAHGRDDASVYWNMGWAYYLAGDYAASLEASRRALEKAPDLMPVIMNIGTALLAQGDTEEAMQEYERGLSMAADPESGVPAAWSRLYLRLTVEDLDRLIHTLDGRSGFYQSPDLSHVQDRAALREAAVAARRRIKEGIVAIETTGSPQVQPTTARLSPLAFGLAAGRRGELLGEADTFPRGVLSVVVSLSYQDMPAGAILSRRVIRMQWSGVPEYLPQMGEDLTWNGDSAGTLVETIESPWPGDRGLLPGIYTVEYYVSGNLVQAASFTIPEKDEAIIGPLVFSSEISIGGVAHSPSGLFPAGVDVGGVCNYSGMEAGTELEARWYRDGQLYQQETDTMGASWGVRSFYLYNVPPGSYRLELFLAGQDEALQSAEFQVVEVEEYLAALGTEPDDAFFHRDLGDAYAYRDDYEQAGLHYQKAVTLDPQCAECYYQWWSILYDQGQFAQAIETLEKAVELRPREYSYLCKLGKTYLAAQDEENALRVYRQAVPLAPAYVYNAWGNALYDQERYEEAAAKYQQAIELEPGEAVYYANLGGAYTQMGEYDLAVAAYEQATAVDPGYAEAYNKAGNVLYDQGKYLEAVEQYLKAVELDPLEAVYWANLGGAYSELGEYESAASALEQAVTLDPRYAWAYNRWGNVLYIQGDYTAAAEKYRRAAELEPTDAVYWANLGDAYNRIGEYEEAIAALQEAVAADPRYARAYNLWGNALYGQGEYAAAVEPYQQAVELEPDDPVLWNNLGGAYYELAQYDQAIAAFERAVTLDPGYAFAYNRWGNALYVQGRYAEAAEKYRLAVEASPNTAVYSYNLGLAYYHLGETEQAIAALERAAELAAQAGDEGLRQDAEAWLEQLR